MKLSSTRERKTRQLLSLGAVFVYVTCFAGGCPPKATVTANDKSLYAYVTNADDNTVSRYSIDSTTRDLKLLGTTPVGRSPRSVMTVANFAYVANSADNTISQFQIQSDGSLKPLTPPTIATGLSPGVLVQATSASPAIDVAVLNQGDNSISRYDLNTDGTLKLIATHATGTTPVGMITIGAYDTIVNSGSNTLTVLSSQLTTAPLPQLPTGQMPVDIVSTYSRVYVSNSIDNSISEFPIDQMSTATAQSDATVTAPGRPMSMTSTGGYGSELFVYVATPGGIILQYGSDMSTGLLSPLSGAEVTFAPQPAVIREFDSSIYLVGNTSHTVTRYAVATASGASHGTIANTGNTVTTGRNPTSIGFAYITGGSEVLSTTIK